MDRWDKTDYSMCNQSYDHGIRSRLKSIGFHYKLKGLAQSKILMSSVVVANSTVGGFSIIFR